MTKRRLLIVVLIFLVLFVIFVPFETSVIPQWRVQVVDVNGSACANMHVTQSWGHYRLYLGGNFSSDDRFTDANGYVQFPERTIQASLLRRIIMPIITRMTTIMHGGWRIDGAVWAIGIKDVAWLSYESGKPMPEKMGVEKCLSDESEQTDRVDLP